MYFGIRVHEDAFVVLDADGLMRLSLTHRGWSHKSSLINIRLIMLHMILFRKFNQSHVRYFQVIFFSSGCSKCWKSHAFHLPWLHFLIFHYLLRWRGRKDKGKGDGEGKGRERKGRGVNGMLSPFGSLVALKELEWKKNIFRTLQLLNAETDSFFILPLPPNLGENKRWAWSIRESFHTPSLSTQPNEGNFLSFHLLTSTFFFSLWFPLKPNIV